MKHDFFICISGEVSRSLKEKIVPENLVYAGVLQREERTDPRV